MNTFSQTLCLSCDAVGGACAHNIHYAKVLGALDASPKHLFKGGYLYPLSIYISHIGRSKHLLGVSGLG